MELTEQLRVPCQSLSAMSRSFPCDLLMISNPAKRIRTAMNGPAEHCSRRAVLQMGQLTAFGVGWSAMCARANANQASSTSTDAARHKSTQRKAGRAKNCILIWLDGGPSHLETFDLKPQAPIEVRGPLQAIATSVPGIQISECLPELARRMNDVAVVRSMTSPLGEHNLGTHYLLTGYRPTPVLQYPAFQAAASFQQTSISGQRQQSALPDHIAIPDYRVGGSNFSGNGFLPAEFSPFSAGSDPARADFQVAGLTLPPQLSLSRIDRRQQFAKQLQRWHQAHDTLPETAAQESAFRMLTAADARSAFRLEDEDAATRQRYGRKTIGQSCLLARRLVERGVRFVTVNDRGWDTHENLYTRLKEGYTGAQTGVGLIPSLDLAISALIDDLKQRNLLDETLIVVMGEFGRTPKINTQGGRDHWPRVFSAALAGGGVRGGQVVGSSDAVGESPADRPVTPADFIATLYTLLGIDPASQLSTSDGRPVRLTTDDAQPISELLT